MGRVYLDHNATAPLRAEARAAVLAELNQPAANPSSVHREGSRARAVIDTARREVASLLNARPHEIVFTSSGTEACNLAISGSAEPLVLRGGRIAALAIEHPAVLEPLDRLAADGWTIDLIPVGSSGAVSIEDVEKAIDPDTVLVIAMWANNETGAVQPIEAIASVCAVRGVRLFVDAVQAAGRIPIDLVRQPIDLLAVSSHKVGGPAGAGALFVREGTKLAPHVLGGGQESGLRGGTESPAMIAGFGAAAQATRTTMARDIETVRSLRDRLIDRVRAEVPGARLIAESANRLANTAQFAVPYEDEEILILALDRAGYAVSAGSACAAGAHRKSHVLAAMNALPRGYAAVRVSLGAGNIVEEVDGFAAALATVVAPSRSGESIR